MNSTGVDLHALAKFGVCTGFVLVPAVPEPTLDLSHLPVQLLGEAVQMAGIWILCARKHKTIHSSRRYCAASGIFSAKKKKIKKKDLCDGCKHFFQDCVGLGPPCDARMDVETLGARTGDESVRDADVGHQGHVT